MGKAVELKIIEPMYSTYHHQGAGTAIIADNLNIRNWYLNQAIQLNCDRGFLYGKFSPDIEVTGSSIWENPYIEKKRFWVKYLGSAVNTVIRNLIDSGYYVYYLGVDDYYVEGKTWYHERHLNHDGLICGYDQNKKTYKIFAYDKSWIYRVFETPQKGFNEGQKAEAAKGNYGILWAVKSISRDIVLEPSVICSKIKEYLNSSLDMYPPYINDRVYGVAVYDYLAMYLNKLIDGSIPYEMLDRRVFRLIWEHKKVMYERICAVEHLLKLGHTLSVQYEDIVKISDNIRMMYASYHTKKRDGILSVIRDKLISMKKEEVALLNDFILKTEAAIK